jgi:hypothetical protein
MRRMTSLGELGVYRIKDLCPLTTTGQNFSLSREIGPVKGDQIEHFYRQPLLSADTYWQQLEQRP